MPGYDRTGPEGAGPLTGRQMGRCTGYGAKQRKAFQPENPHEDSDNIQEPGYGFGRGGRGFGWGRGMGFRFRFRGGLR
jgi:hypothetical protein